MESRARSRSAQSMGLRGSGRVSTLLIFIRGKSAALPVNDAAPEVKNIAPSVIDLSPYPQGWA